MGHSEKIVQGAFCKDLLSEEQAALITHAQKRIAYQKQLRAGGLTEKQALRQLYQLNRELDQIAALYGL